MNTECQLESWISEKIGCKTALVTREATERFQVSRLKKNDSAGHSRGFPINLRF
jgi:hypothetical protein